MDEDFQRWFNGPIKAGYGTISDESFYDIEHPDEDMRRHALKKWMELAWTEGTKHARNQQRKAQTFVDPTTFKAPPPPPPLTRN
jgi:hypothetical protein